MPDDSGDLAVNTRVHLPLPMRTRGCGCTGHPAFPTPSFSGRRLQARPGRKRAAGMRGYALTSLPATNVERVCARERKRRSRHRHSGAMRSIELRCEIAHRRISRFRVWSFGPSRNDGRWIASLALAMTVVQANRLFEILNQIWPVPEPGGLYLSPCGRHRPPSAAVLENKKNAEAKLRLRRIARCDPDEGLWLIEGPEPLTPTSRASFARLGLPQGERELTAVAEALMLRLR